MTPAETIHAQAVAALTALEQVDGITRVSQPGWGAAVTVDGDPYEVGVIDMGSTYRWDVTSGTHPEGLRHIIAGRTDNVESAWQAGCQALADHVNGLARMLVDMDAAT